MFLCFIRVVEGDLSVTISLTDERGGYPSTASSNAAESAKRGGREDVKGACGEVRSMFLFFALQCFFFLIA